MILATSKPGTPTEIESGVKTRDFTVKAGNTGHNVTVIQLTDLHIGYCNDEDLKNPTLASTDEHRLWPGLSRVLSNLDETLS